MSEYAWRFCRECLMWRNAAPRRWESGEKAEMWRQWCVFIPSLFHSPLDCHTEHTLLLCLQINNNHGFEGFCRSGHRFGREPIGFGAQGCRYLYPRLCVRHPALTKFYAVILCLESFHTWFGPPRSGWNDENGIFRVCLSPNFHSTFLLWVHVFLWNISASLLLTLSPLVFMQFCFPMHA